MRRFIVWILRLAAMPFTFLADWLEEDWPEGMLAWLEAYEN